MLPRSVFRNHHLQSWFVLFAFLCILLPVPSRARWRPPCCRPRTDHPTRYNNLLSFSLSAACSVSLSPRHAPSAWLCFSKANREKRGPLKGARGNQTFSVLLYCSFPCMSWLRFWWNLVFISFSELAFGKSNHPKQPFWLLLLLLQTSKMELTWAQCGGLLVTALNLSPSLSSFTSKWLPSLHWIALKPVSSWVNVTS